MLDSYEDIRSRIPEPPTWYDRHGCPRYCEAIPENCSHVYADRVVFMKIACQACRQEFLVEFALSRYDRFDKESKEFKEIDVEALFYGDPPGECCPVGATMASDSVEVMSAWRRSRKPGLRWERTHQNVPVPEDVEEYDDYSDLDHLFEE